jgi:hypothetical protein
MNIKMVCSKCGCEPKRNESMSNHQWDVYDNKPCEFCGGKIEMNFGGRRQKNKESSQPAHNNARDKMLEPCPRCRYNGKCSYPKACHDKNFFSFEPAQDTSPVA